MISRYQVTADGLIENQESPTWISVTNASFEEKSS